MLPRGARDRRCSARRWSRSSSSALRPSSAFCKLRSKLLLKLANFATVQLIRVPLELCCDSRDSETRDSESTGRHDAASPVDVPPPLLQPPKVPGRLQGEASAEPGAARGPAPGAAAAATGAAASGRRCRRRTASSCGARAAVRGLAAGETRRLPQAPEAEPAEEIEEHNAGELGSSGARAGDAGVGDVGASRASPLAAAAEGRPKRRTCVARWHGKSRVAPCSAVLGQTPSFHGEADEENGEAPRNCADLRAPSMRVPAPRPPHAVTEDSSTKASAAAAAWAAAMRIAAALAALPSKESSSSLAPRPSQAKKDVRLPADLGRGSTATGVPADSSAAAVPSAGTVVL